MLKTLLVRLVLAALSLLPLHVGATPPPNSTLRFSAPSATVRILTGGSAAAPVTFLAEGAARFSMLYVAALGFSPSGSDFGGFRGSCLPPDTDTTCTVNIRFTPTAAGRQVLGISFSWCDATGCQDAFSSVEGTAYVSLVSELYQTVLHRDAEPAAQAFWTNEINRALAAGVPIADVWRTLAESFFNSAEYRERGIGDPEYMADLYQAFLGRAPDVEGAAYWSRQLSDGLTRDAARTSFELSNEYAQFLLAINRAGEPPNATGELLAPLYRGFLGRLPDSEGYRRWSEQIADDVCRPAELLATVDRISRAFVESPEYAARGRSQAEFARDLYDAMLGRGSDVGGLAYWTVQLNLGISTREEVRQAFLQSEEYAARVHKASLSACPGMVLTNGF
jgi:hypothetical protein